MEQPDATSLIPVLQSDHRWLLAALDDPNLAAAGEHGARLREDVVANLVRHFVAEEQYLHPAVRQHRRDGDGVTEAWHRRDRAVETRLRELEHDLDPEAAAALIGRVRADLGAHVEEQEPVLDALEAVVPADELDRAGRGVLGAEQLAPTHPRAVAPEEPTVSKVWSLVSGFVDHVRDYYGGSRGED